LFPPFAWNFRARAIEPGRLLVMNGAHLLVASEEDEVFGYELMKRLCQLAIERLQATRKKLLEMRGRTNSMSATPVLADPSDWSHPVRDSMEAVAMDHPFFEGLSSEHLKLLGSYGMQVQFKKGESIFREGDVANRFYLIEEGKVALESHLKDGPPVGVQTIGKGDVLGWSWLFPPYYWNFDARAVEPTKAIFLYGTRLREECENDPGLGLQLLKRMAKVIIHRLQSTRGLLNELNLRTAAG